MGKLIEIPKNTFTAKLFEASWDTSVFKVAGTLDGLIDLAVPGGGTYPLSLDEARGVIVALNNAIADVKANCLHARDSLLGSE